MLERYPVFVDATSFSYHISGWSVDYFTNSVSAVWIPTLSAF